jgi:peptidoglycan/LPS O-acetylase OafA/YrhL
MVPPLNLNGKNDSISVLRLILSLLVIFSHSFSLLAVSEPLSGASTSFGEVAVKGFFVLSGYLLCLSAINQKPMNYFLNRVMRVFPALAISVVLISLVFAIPAFVVGRNSQLRDLLSFVYTNLTLVNPNRMFEVNGIFENNPIPRVLNGSLWTITWEFWSYCLLYFLIWLPRKILSRIKSVTTRNSHSVYFVLFSLYLVIFSSLANNFESRTNTVEYFIFELFPCVLVGAWLRMLLKLQINLTRISIVIASLIVLLSIGMSDAHVITIFTFCFVLVIISKIQIVLPPSLRGIDPSYGVYLYGYPIQQAFIYFGITDLIILFVSSSIVSICAGLASWHYIEKRFIGIFSKIQENGTNHFPSR